MADAGADEADGSEERGSAGDAAGAPPRAPPEELAVLKGTAAQIANRAAELFAKKGIAQSSIREIAEAAGVTKPMLYYYFGNKEGLIAHIVRSSLRAFQDVVTALDDATPLAEALYTISASQLAFADENPAIITLMARVDTAPAGEVAGLDLEQERVMNHLLIRGLFERAIARGELDGGSPDLLAMSYGGALIVHIMARIHRPELFTTSPAEAARQLVELFLNGALPRPAGAPREGRLT